jgi:hypothetical protein
MDPLKPVFEMPGNCLSYYNEYINSCWKAHPMVGSVLSGPMVILGRSLTHLP